VLISQNGNTANNGFYNALLLNEHPEIQIVGRPSTSGIRHAFSQPAWDIETNVAMSDANSPNWSLDGRTLNDRYSSAVTYPASLRNSAEFSESPRNYQSDVRERNAELFAPKILDVAQILESASLQATNNRGLGRLSPLVTGAHGTGKRIATTLREFCIQDIHEDVHITFGAATPHISRRRQTRTNSVVVEHGQVRWILDGPAAVKSSRRDFQQLCDHARHLWITNLDERTFQVADLLFPGKWSALPHPYVIDTGTPYSDIPSRRDLLCNRLGTNFLLFSPSSISIGGDQQKGTDKLIQAIAKLRFVDEVRVGSIFVNWGSNVSVACRLIHDLGISDQCLFIDPLPRVALQTFMSNFDLVSDQFDYDAFGGLTIRTLEQGMPLLSRPVGDRAAELMGGRPPLFGASTVDEIREQILRALSQITSLGRTRYLEMHRLQGRDWILRRHHHSLTQELQVERYRDLLRKNYFEVNPGRWGQLADRAVA
jgi:hypothetical protein